VTVYLSDILAGLRRRWWLALVGVLATVAASGYVMTLVPVDQIARASVLLVPPQSVVGDAGNPYLTLNGLQPTADVLARALNNGKVHTDLAPPGGDADFVVERDASSSGPVLVVEVTATDADRALGMLDSVLTTMPTVFQELQEEVGAPASSIIELTTVTRDDVPEGSNKGQIRAVLVVALGGLAGTAFLAYALDGLLMRRRLERARAAGGETAGTRDDPLPAPGPAHPGDRRAEPGRAPGPGSAPDGRPVGGPPAPALVPARRDVTSPRTVAAVDARPEVRPEDLTRRARPRRSPDLASPPAGSPEGPQSGPSGISTHRTRPASTAPGGHDERPDGPTSDVAADQVPLMVPTAGGARNPLA